MSEQLFTQLETYGQRRFTGALSVKLADHLTWTLQFDRGGLIWAEGGIHPRRRWQRQLRRSGCSQSVLVEEERLAPDAVSYYVRLCELQQHGQISAAQAGWVARGVVTEVLFDIVQAIHLAGRHHLEMAVLPDVAPGDRGVRLDSLAVTEACRHVVACWQEWCELGLAAFSPDAMPTIREHEVLQAATSSGFYAYLSALADAGQTLRDAAIGYSGCNVAELAGILVPFLQRHVLALVAVPDLVDSEGDTVPELHLGTANGTMPTLTLA